MLVKVKPNEFQILRELEVETYGDTSVSYTHLDLGVGTLDSIDGELIVLDGKAYQAKGSGDHPEIVEVSPEAKVPYAAVVPHQAEVIFRH